MVKSEGKKINHINFIFTSDRYLLELNKRYLKHNSYTDIITFDLSEKDQLKNAEIYISVDRVKENSRLMNISFKSEIHRVIFHGVLHLCGYKDKSKKDTKKIRNREDFYLYKYSSF